MTGLVVVSHSATAAAGIAEVAAEMGGDVPIEAVGGDGRGGIGTVPDDIAAALASADDGDGVVVLVDLGSAVMNAEVAIETSDVDATLADAPVLVDDGVATDVGALDAVEALDRRLRALPLGQSLLGDRRRRHVVRVAVGVGHPVSGRPRATCGHTRYR